MVILIFHWGQLCRVMEGLETRRFYFAPSRQPPSSTQLISRNHDTMLTWDFNSSSARSLHSQRLPRRPPARPSTFITHSLATSTAVSPTLTLSTWPPPSAPFLKTSAAAAVLTALPYPTMALPPRTHQSRRR